MDLKITQTKKTALKKRNSRAPEASLPYCHMGNRMLKREVICLQSPSSGPRCPLSGATASRQTPPY